MQAISGELAAILKSHFQAGASGFRSRVEIDVATFVPAGGLSLVQSKTVQYSGGGAHLTFDNPVTAGNLVVAIAVERGIAGSPRIAPSGWATVADVTYNTSDHTSMYWRNAVAGTDDTVTILGTTNGVRLTIMEFDGSATLAGSPATKTNQPASTAHSTGPATLALPGIVVAVSVADDDGAPGGAISTFTEAAGFTTLSNGAVSGGPPPNGFSPTSIHSYMVADAGSYSHAPTTNYNGRWCGIVAAFEPTSPPSGVETRIFKPTRISIDKSLRMTADQAEVELVNEELELGWGPSSVVKTNHKIRIYQWYGDPASAVRTFTGLVDLIHDHRDVLTTTLTARDMMALLIDQTFSATAPQGATEAGAVRTADNGVYLAMEVSAIVADLLDRAGWPSADRAVTATSYVLDEFVIGDGSSWADTIIGETQLTGLVGYSAWADELGVFHFAPTSISQNLTEPVSPTYTFRAGEDIMSLDDSTDQYDLRTRFKVRGPLTTRTLEDTWRELWRTSKITQPVGIWHDLADVGNIRVISKATKRLYKLRQSDRKVLSSVYLGSVISHPLGLSGDPSDSTVYWVLDAPWAYGGSTSGNSVVKVRKSDNHVLATYSLPSGQWSALKVSSSYMWLTNLTTDRFYKRSKADGSAIANYGHSYSSVTQANPSGVMVDGTTLYVFWANGGTTARFLVCNESAPGTVVKVIKTAGTVLHGGEMDVVNHQNCWGDSDSLNLVAKFTLLNAVDLTTQVFAEVVNIDLEDELGTLAQSEPRSHDAHPGDADHPFEVRRETLDLSVITSLAQATETAQRQLDIASQRRRVVDAGIVGNPALQKTDPVAMIDTVTGMSDAFVVDTYRSEMDAAGTYVGTLALLPVASVDDTPADDGNAS